MIAWGRGRYLGAAPTLAQAETTVAAFRAQHPEWALMVLLVESE